jgi:AsmA protein
MVTGGRRLRRLAVALGAVLLALAAAATWGPGLLNLERYRGQIARQVGRAIGREVSVGAITASVWRLGAEAHGIRVAERAEYGTVPFLEADALRVRVELLPLLHGQVRVATAVLERPRIHMVRGRAGRWNIEDLWSAAGPGAAAPAGRLAPESPRAPRPAAAGVLLVKDLRARGGELRIDDLAGARGTGASLAVRNFRLDVRQDDPPDAVAIRIAGDVSGGSLEAAATLAPRGGALTVDGRAALKGFDLGPLEAFLGKGGAAGPADLALAAKGPWPGLEVSGDLDLARARLNLGTMAPKAPGEEAHLTFAGRLVGEGADLPKVQVRWRGAAIEGRAAAVRLQPLEMTFAAETARLDLDTLLAAPVAPQGAARKTSGIPGFFGAAPAWAAAPPAPAGPAASRAAATGGAPAARAEGTVHAKAVRWHGVEAGDVRAAVAYRDSILGIRNVTGSVFGGRLAGAGTVDLRGRYPSLAASGRLEEAQLQPLVAAMAPGKKVEARGVLTAEARVTSPALVPGNTLGTLVGSGNFVARDGRVAGYKPLDRLADTLAVAPGGATLLKGRLDEFQRLSATFTLDKGFLRTQDLTLVRPDGQTKAAGSMNLLDTSLDFNVAIRIGKVGLDAKVTGTAADPLVVPTMAHLDKRFEMEFDRALKGDRGKKVQDLLKNLLR